jgi:hypothetical protein
VTAKRIIRVFPRRTNGTPDDDMAFVGELPLFRPEADEVHVSCTFTWDLPEARRLARSWGRSYRVKIGGPAFRPAFGETPGEFVPGRYLRHGYVITSRGCPKSCWFCLVSKREGDLRTLPIRDGYDVVDNNLLACPRPHIEAVFDMLSRQKERARFSGGFDACYVEPWLVKALKEIRTDAAFLAYDRPGVEKVLAAAIDLLRPCFWKRRLGVYVLCGYPGDTIEAAKERCQWVAGHGALPFPMFYRDENWKGRVPSRWQALVRKHARGIPAPEVA